MAAAVPADPGVVVRAVVRCIAVVALIGIAVEARPQTSPADAFQIAVNVDLVVLQATVSERKGRLTRALSEKNFQIYENGIPQSIHLFRHEDSPVTVGLVVDHSGSMQPKLAHVIEAARTFARLSNPQDQMFVVNFNEKVTLGLPAAMPFTDRPDDLNAAISGMHAAGQTALYDAVIQGLNRLRSGSFDKKVLIVISDGGDNASVLRFPEVIRKVEESGALIYTIGIFDDDDPDKNPEVLRHLSRATGGEAFFPHRLDEVVTICENIAREIRNQYTLGYSSSNTVKAGAYQKIRVAAEADGYKLEVRTRAGYIR